MAKQGEKERTVKSLPQNRQIYYKRSEVLALKPDNGLIGKFLLNEWDGGINYIYAFIWIGYIFSYDFNILKVLKKI